MKFEDRSTELATVRGVDDSLHQRHAIAKDEMSMSVGFRLVLTGLTFAEIEKLPQLFTGQQVEFKRKAKKSTQNLTL